MTCFLPALKDEVSALNNLMNSPANRTANRIVRRSLLASLMTLVAVLAGMIAVAAPASAAAPAPSSLTANDHRWEAGSALVGGALTAGTVVSPGSTLTSGPRTPT